MDVTKVGTTDFAFLTAGIGRGLAALNAGESFLGGLADEIEGQQTFDATMTDALTTGLGSLVDADMDAASTRLSALQTQQQPGTQALGIANSDGQVILRLIGIG